MKNHNKHAHLNRPSLGTFSRREWAILGAPCNLIQALSQQLIPLLADQFKLAYVDADHSSGQDQQAEETILNTGSSLVYTDKIDFHRFDIKVEADTFKYRQWFNDQDLVLVNGNHFKAQRQLVMLDPRKFDSLNRKLDRLTQVEGFIKVEAEQEVPDFLQQHLPNWQELPVWQFSETKEISSFIRQQAIRSTPEVSGLVLAGGKSQRMGQDKGQLVYHGMPQREFLYQLIETVNLPAFLSCRPDQIDEMPIHHDLIPDSFLGLGPFGAILSAFRHDPNRAWLVLACDLPFVDQDSIEFMLQHRDPSALATAFHNPATDFPDPLVTLWEPRAYPVLMQFLAQGYSCPRKVLINSSVNLLTPTKEHLLTNVNNPADYEKALKSLQATNNIA
jgi:molybdopterin-guanine dinucleotide biosynthesis protein A